MHTTFNDALEPTLYTGSFRKLTKGAAWFFSLRSNHQIKALCTGVCVCVFIREFTLCMSGRVKR